MRLEGKVCIVTGAGRGIGEATAMKMAQEGAHVVVSDIDDAAGERIAQQIRSNGASAVYVRADVSQLNDVQELMSATLDTFGRLDVLHNNAGVHETNFTERAQSHELDNEIWDKVIAVNLKGVWMCSKYAAPLLESAGGGAIVNAASISGIIGEPMSGAYGPSKAAVIQLTRVMAIELATQGTRVNCYAPGNIDTPMLHTYFETSPSDEAAEMIRRQLVDVSLIPRLGHSDEIAELVVFLASDQSSFINGACITIDGGTTAWRGFRPQD